MYIKFKKSDSNFGYDVRIYVSKENNGTIWFNKIDGVVAILKGIFREQDSTDVHKMIVKDGTKIFLEKINNKMDGKTNE